MPRPVPLTLLLPPSEGKAEGGGRTRWTPDSGIFGEQLGPVRAEIAAALAAAGGGSEKLLGVGGRHLDRALAANATLVGAPTLPAGKRYTGVVWDHLGLASLGGPERARATRSIVVVSGLLGLVGVNDPVPDYRLKMGVSLTGIGVVSRAWRPHLSGALNEHVAGRLVVDLLPKEHAAAWAPEGSARAHLEVVFVERDGKVAGHDAKAAKGLLARHVLAAGGDPRRALATFDHPRFTLRVVDGP